MPRTHEGAHNIHITEHITKFNMNSKVFSLHHFVNGPSHFSTNLYYLIINSEQTVVQITKQTVPQHSACGMNTNTKFVTDTLVRFRPKFMDTRIKVRHTGSRVQLFLLRNIFPSAISVTFCIISLNASTKLCSHLIDVRNFFDRRLPNTS